MEQKTNYTGTGSGSGGFSTNYKQQDNQSNVKTQSPQQDRNERNERNDRNDQGTQGGSPSNTKRNQGGNFRSRASKTNKNRGRIEGDVNDRNPNRSDFEPKKKGFGEDKAPRKQGGVRPYDGNSGGYRKKGTGPNQPSRGRQFDKKSGTGIDPTPKKNESGSYNIGNPIKENLNAEEDAKKEKEESSESSEYFPEPDEEGEEKKR